MDRISLNGQWRFALDRHDVGTLERWYAKPLVDSIRLPGSLMEQGIGDIPDPKTSWAAGKMFTELLPQAKYARYHDATPVRCAFWNTPGHLYTGVAWYQREIAIPTDWAGQHITLHLERPHWQTSVYLGDQLIGTRDSLGTPHEYDLPLTPGQRHLLSIRVDNRMQIGVGVDAHSVTDHTQGNWNGIVGAIALRATPQRQIRGARVTTDLKQGTVTLSVRLGGPPLGSEQLTIDLACPNHAFPSRTVNVGTGPVAQIVMELPPDAKLWDEFSPTLYTLDVALHRDGDLLHRHIERVGLRHVSTTGTQITINGRAVLLRGTLECCVFPLTGYPPMDVDSWRRILGIARDHGLNHLRFHSWTPPEAAFVAADELGFYFQVECSCWAEFGTGGIVDTWLYAETDRVAEAYGNHASFIMLTAGNEPSGEEPRRSEYLNEWVEHFIGCDTRRLYSGGSGWPRLESDQYRITLDSRGLPMWAKDPSTAGDYRDYVAKQDRPIISHEIGQYCAFPNLSEDVKYTGVYRATVLEIARDMLAAAGMADQAHEFLMGSGRFQTEFYKEEIEACLRTRGWAGFQLLDLHDFPGQGTAPVGVLDAFWDSKGYCTAEQFRRFCSSTVVLARIPRRLVQHGEQLHIPIEVAHYGPSDLASAAVSWRLLSGGTTVASGHLSAACVSTGSVTEIGTINLLVEPSWGAAKLRLETSLNGAQNAWSIWSFPGNASRNWPADVLIARSFDAATEEALQAGRTVLLLPSRDRIAGFAVGVFHPLYWNRVTFPNNRAHLMGLVVKAGHLALAEFPTDEHSDWQWHDLVNRSKPMVLNQLPAGFRPIVQPIDDWTESRKLALLMEARVGPGRLVICSMDLENDLDTRPAARQLRASLSAYLAQSPDAATQDLTPDQIQTLFREPTFSERMGAKAIRTDSSAPGHEPHHLLDGNPATLWHTLWWGEVPSYPHEVVIRFECPVQLQSVTLTPRRLGDAGRFRHFELYTAMDDGDWQTPAYAGEMPSDGGPQTATLPADRPARFIRLVALSPWSASDKTASLAGLHFTAHL